MLLTAKAVNRSYEEYLGTGETAREPAVCTCCITSANVHIVIHTACRAGNSKMDSVMGSPDWAGVIRLLGLSNKQVPLFYNSPLPGQLPCEIFFLQYIHSFAFTRNLYHGPERTSISRPESL